MSGIGIEGSLPELLLLWFDVVFSLVEDVCKIII